MTIKCFFAEKTGRVNTIPIPCNNPDCVEQIHNTDIPEWRRVDTGETMVGHCPDFGPGAMWFQEYVSEDGKTYSWDNDDGRHLIVLTPAGTWDIDSRASNCDLPNDRLHRCWVRTGEIPNITVGKQGLTCTAGGGSIRQTNYHAMLENGELRQV